MSPLSTQGYVMERVVGAPLLLTGELNRTVQCRLDMKRGDIPPLELFPPRATLERNANLHG